MAPVNLLLKKPFSKLDGLIAVSELAKNQVEKFFPGKYRIIANGIDKQRFSKAKPFEKFNDNKMNILFVGRLVAHKNVEALIEKFNAYFSDKNAVLRIVGAGEQEVYLKSKYESKQVIFVGNKFESDLIKEFQGRFDKFSVEPIQSSGGVFEVMVNDNLEVFSKKRVGRFPNSSYEVIKTINDAIDERRLG